MDLVSAPPAQLTNTSSLPNSSMVVSTSPRQAWALVTSVGTASARQPIARTSLAVDSSGSGRRPASTTSAPCSANTSAAPRPIPVPPPVMTATRPSSENRLFIEALLCGREPLDYRLAGYTIVQSAHLCVQPPTARMRYRALSPRGQRALCAWRAPGGRLGRTKADYALSHPEKCTHDPDN